MLHIIKGRSGYGKTTYIWNHIFQNLKSDEKIIVLVPEQFSFETEKLFCKFQSINQKNNQSFNVEVLSFKRLSEMVFREYGGLTKKTLNNVKISIIIHNILNELKDDLKVYKRQTDNHMFVRDIISVISVFNSNNVTFDDIKQCIEKIENNLLATKLEGIFKIYKAYHQKINEKYNDDSNILNLVHQKLKSNNFFKNQKIYIDGFTSFTQSEFNILEQMMIQSKDVYISLCLDEQKSQYGMLNHIYKTNLKLISIAQDNGILVCNDVLLKAPRRFKSKDLIYLENFMFDFFSGNNFKTKRSFNLKDDINIVECNSIKQEVTYTAAKISYLIKEKNYKYNEISIIVRDADNYKSYIDNIFKQYEIPYFLDEKINIKDKILIIFVESMLTVVNDEFNTANIFKLLKTGFLPIEDEEISKLEIYCSIWNIDRSLWLKEFNFNPRGLLKDFNDDDYLTLESINKTRLAVVDILMKLKSRIKKRDSVENFIKNIYYFLVDLKIVDKLEEIAQNISCCELFINENQKIWNCLIDIFDDLVDITDDKNEIDLKEFLKLFDVAVSEASIKLVPQMIDQVLINKAEHMVNVDSKIVFVLGLNQNVFPGVACETPFFSEKEKKLLRDENFNVYDNKVENSLIERYYVYKAVTATSEKIYLSYHNCSVDGTKNYRALFLNQLINDGVNFEKFDEKDLILIQNEKTAYNYICRNLYNNGLLNLIRVVFGDNQSFLNKIDVLSQIKNKDSQNINLVNRNALKKYLGTNLNLSPSSIERFYICKFKFFCNDILKLKVVKRADFTKVEQGIIMHDALKKLLVQDLISNLNDIENKIKSIVDDCISKSVGYKNVYNNKNKYICDEIVKSVIKTSKYIIEEQNVSKFKVQGLELEISWQSIVKPMHLQLKTGEHISVSGKIDRVDVYDDGVNYYIRVIDYKSGSKTFCIDDVYYGLNMQMLLYLFMLTDYCNKNTKKKFKSAGVLYMPIKSQIPIAERALDEEKVKQLEFCNFRMNGLLIDDVNVLTAMEEDLKGRFIPVEINKDQTLSKRSSVINEDNFESLKEHIKNIIKFMAEDIFSGNISAIPTEGSRYKDVCAYCDYKSICNLSDDKVLKVLSSPEENWYAKSKNDNS